MTGKLGWAVVGTGGVALRFAGDLRFSATGRVAAVVSRDAARGRAFAARLGAAVPVRTFEEALADPDVGAVYLASPNACHAGQAAASLRARKPVLIEKPMAVDAAEAAAIRDASLAAGVLAMEAMWMCFTPGIARLRSLVRSGAVGEVRFLDAQLSYDHAPEPASRLLDPARGGGALLDLGVYPVSLAHHLLGPPDEVQALSLGTATGAEAAGAVLMRHGTALSTLRYGFTAEGSNTAVVTGRSGVIAVARQMLCPPALTLRATAGPRPPSAEAAAPGSRHPYARFARNLLGLARSRTVLTPYRGTGLQYQADHFAGLLSRGLVDSDVRPLAEACAVLGIIDAAKAGSNRVVGR